MADTDIVQVIAEARVDARSLSEFVFKPAGFIVDRRLAPPINTLQFYVDNLDRELYRAQTDIAIAIKDAQANSGFNIVGDFATGATLTKYNDAVKSTDGTIYRWGGDLPKTVASGSTPQSTGGFSTTSWIEVSSADVQASIKRLERGLPQYSYTLMGKAFDSRDGVGDPMASWTHANVAYDAGVDNFVIVYNTNAGHSITTCSVLMRTKPTHATDFSDVKVIASDKGNYSYKCQASGIAKNGDYIALVASFPWGVNSHDKTYVYRSTNKGQSYTRTEMTVSGVDVLAYNGDVSGFLVTESGRVITMARRKSGGLAEVFYSDDNCVTWSKSMIGTGSLTATEPAWCDLGGGKLIALFRDGVGSSYTVKKPALFSTSDDNGATWTQPVVSQSITNLSEANGELIANHDTKTVEFIHHSREVLSDGKSSLLRSWATFDDAFNDNFRPQVQIGRLAGNVPWDNSRGDSGYVGAAKAQDGTINAFFYNGKAVDAQVNWAVGTPNTTYKNKISDFDDRTGVANIVKTNHSPMPIFKNGLKNPNFYFGFNRFAGVSEAVSDAYRFKAVASTGANIRIMAFIDRPINFDKINKIGAYFKDRPKPVLTPDGVGEYDTDIAVSLHPAMSESPPRVLVGFSDDKNYVELDTANMRGEYYVAITYNSRKNVPTFADLSLIELYGDVDHVELDEPLSRNTYFYNKLGDLGVSGFNTGLVHPASFIESEGIKGSVYFAGSSLVMESSKEVDGAYRYLLVFKTAIPTDAKKLEVNLTHINNATTSINNNAEVLIQASNVANETSLAAANRVHTTLLAGVTDNRKAIIDIEAIRAANPSKPYLYIGFLLSGEHNAADSANKPKNARAVIDSLVVYK